MRLQSREIEKEKHIRSYEERKKEKKIDLDVDNAISNMLRTF